MSKLINNTFTSGTFSDNINNDYITYGPTTGYSTEIDVNICHKYKDKELEMDTEKHDIIVDVVDNGFMASIGNRKYVFGNLDELDDWISENLETPSKARKTVSDSKDITKIQEDLIRSFEKMCHNHHNIPQRNVDPFNQQIAHKGLKGSRCSGVTSDKTTDNSNVNLSSEILEQLLGKEY